MSKIHKADNIWVDPRRPVLIYTDNHTTGGIGLAVSADPELKLEESRRTAEKFIEDARNQAQSILNHATKEASEVLTSAKQEADKILEEAHRQGYTAGLEEGAAQGRNEYEKSCSTVLEALTAIQMERNNIIDSMEEEFIALVLDAAEKVLKYELDRCDNAFVNMIKNALSGIRAPGNLTLRIHPDQYAGVYELTENPPSGKEWIREMRIIQDANMDIGDCRIETGCGVVDIGISTQLEQISKAFRHLLPSLV